MLILGIILLAMWVTLAFTKVHALIFVTIVMAVGLTARALTKWANKRKGPKPSLLRQAIMEQLTTETLMKPKILLGTYGSDVFAAAALNEARIGNHTLIVCFIRHVSLSYKHEYTQRLNIDTDLGALRVFSKILDLAHEMGVSVIPVYDTGPDAAELIAENAAMLGCEKVLLGTSRQGALYHLIKGTFQQRLETLLPPEIPVEVITPQQAEEARLHLAPRLASLERPAPATPAIH